MSYLTFKPGKNQHALKSHGMSKLNHLGFKHAAAVKISNTKMTKHFKFLQMEKFPQILLHWHTITTISISASRTSIASKEVIVRDLE